MQRVVLAISSFVAASRVGLNVTTPALRVFPLEVIQAPTTVFGRHPGWGEPGGAAVPANMFKDLLARVIEHPDAKRCGWAMTGYFARADQVKAAADALSALKNKAWDLKLFVDPVMGDAETGRYVDKDVPAAIERLLLPLADIVAPNAWEAETLSGVRVIDAATARAVADKLDKPALVSSVPGEDGRIGAVYAEPGGAAWFAHAPLRENALKGVGDLLSGAFLGGLASGMKPDVALITAVKLTDFALNAALRAKLDELPTTALSMFGYAWPPPVPAGETRMEAL